MGQSNRAHEARCCARAERRQEKRSTLFTSQRVTPFSPTRLKSTRHVRCFKCIHGPSRQAVSARALATPAASARSSGRRDHIFVLGRGSRRKKHSEQQQPRCRFVGSPRRSGRRDGRGAVVGNRTACSRDGRCSRSLQRQPRIGERGKEGIVLTETKIPPKKKKKRAIINTPPSTDARKQTNNNNSDDDEDEVKSTTRTHERTLCRFLSPYLNRSVARTVPYPPASWAVRVWQCVGASPRLSG